MVRSIVGRVFIVSLSFLFLFSSGVYAAAQRFCLITSADNTISQKDLPGNYIIQARNTPSLFFSIYIPATTALNYKNDWWQPANARPVAGGQQEMYCSEYKNLPVVPGNNMYYFYNVDTPDVRFYFVENVTNRVMALVSTNEAGDGRYGNPGVQLQACISDYSGGTPCTGRSSGSHVTSPGLWILDPSYYNIFIKPSFSSLMNHGSPRHKESHEHKRH